MESHFILEREEIKVKIRTLSKRTLTTEEEDKKKTTGADEDNNKLLEEKNIAIMKENQNSVQIKAKC